MHIMILIKIILLSMNLLILILDCNFIGVELLEFFMLENIQT